MSAILTYLQASVMIEKFAGVRGTVLSEFLDLNHTSKPTILVSLMIPKFARDARSEVRRTSQSGHYCFFENRSRICWQGSARSVRGVNST